MADGGHGPTVLHGALCRFAIDPRPVNAARLAEFKLFNKDLVERTFSALPPTTVFCPRKWLPETHYPLWRQKDFMLLYDVNNGVVRPKDHRLIGFAKKETYVTACGTIAYVLEYKPARDINSRSDMFKMFAGPIFHEIEKVVFALPVFVKRIPVRERPAYIRNMLEGHSGPFAITDYTTFEAWFTPEFMDACEFVLYEHLLRNFPFEVGELKRVLCGENHINYRDFNITVRGKRMSGEMCTSLGNGWSNYALAKFTAHKCNCEVIGVFEGDDGFMKFTGPVTTQYIEELGFLIKFSECDSWDRGSFCGLMQSRDGIAFVDPRKKILTFGWSHSPLISGGLEVRLGLLRAKALSLAYEAPQCPIVSTLAIRCLEFTRGIRPRFESGYWEAASIADIQKFEAETMEMLILGPSAEARQDFDEIYGISIGLQMDVEEEIRSWDGGELGGAAVRALLGNNYPTCQHYYDHYLRTTTTY